MNTFKQWFDANLSEYRHDIARYGCDAGFPHITYTSDCVEIYDEFEDEILDTLAQDAEEFGYDSPDAFIATFRRNDMLWDKNQKKNLLVWYMVEKMAHI